MSRVKILTQINLHKISNAFINEKIICLPTDTVYAISCDATNNKAIKRIYKIKKRDLNKPLSIFVSDINMALKYIKLLNKELIFAEIFWPGPLTIVSSKNNGDNLPSLLIKNNKIAVRIPNNKLIQKICRNINRPIIATSANITSNPITNFTDEIKVKFNKKVDIIVEKNNEYQNHNLVTSTIIEFTDKNSYNIMREGKISKKQINSVFEKF